MDKQKNAAANTALEMIKYIIEQARASVDQNGDIEYAKYDELALSLFDNGHVDWLVERVQEMEGELNKQVETGYKFEGMVHDLAEQNKRYREVIEYMKSEINYSLHSSKSKDVKRFYLENAVRYADKALEESE